LQIYIIPNQCCHNLVDSSWYALSMRLIDISGTRYAFFFFLVWQFSTCLVVYFGYHFEDTLEISKFNPSNWPPEL
ncbi:hypothetical protein HN51_046284, partial [Arachis hypogaea]